MADFNSRYFFLLGNLGLPNYQLSSSPFRSTTGSTNMTINGFTSGENWQLFYQQGRYFIRNYDYGSTYQLGVTADSKDVPMLYPRTGGLEQQWTITQVEGGYHMINGLWGNGTELALLPGYQAPGMQVGSSSNIWNITRNPSAEVTGPKGTDMYSVVQGFEVAQVSSSALPSATSYSAPLASTISATLSSPSNTAINPPPASTSSSLSSGAIGGIVVGVIAVFVLSLLALWFFMKRRKGAANNPYFAHDGRPMEKYAFHAELEVPPSELPTPVTDAPRHEKYVVRTPPAEMDAGPVR